MTKPEGPENPTRQASIGQSASRRRVIRPGLRMSIRGRSITLRGLRQSPAGALRWLAILGPGLVAANAGNDAGGIATYSQVGAKLGYELLWLLVLITISLAVVQEMCARLGASTGQGLLDLIRARYGLGWAIFAVGVVLVANAGLIVSEFVGIGAATELLGISRYVSVPIATAFVWYLVVGGSYGSTEKLFICMTLVFFAYPAAAILARPNWGEVARGALVPSLRVGADQITMVVALLGTTITPYMQLFQQSAIVEKGVARAHYGPERADVYVGTVLSNLISAFIIIAAGAALHAHGKTDILTAADAAQALQPVAGNLAQALFAVGLLGAGLLAAGVLPLATAYSISEAFGFRKGVNLDFRRAPIFLGLFSILVAGGGAVALIPNLPVIQLLIGIQVLNGILLPIILVFVLRLVNDRRLIGGLKNTTLDNVLGWATFAIVTAAVSALLGSQLLGLVGINVFPTA